MKTDPSRHNEKLSVGSHYKTVVIALTVSC